MLKAHYQIRCFKVITNNDHQKKPWLLRLISFDIVKEETLSIG